ncbi:hypothetical protein GCM10009696_24280 [Kocuria himachalensis]
MVPRRREAPEAVLAACAADDLREPGRRPALGNRSPGHLVARSMKALTYARYGGPEVLELT